MADIQNYLESRVKDIQHELAELAAEDTEEMLQDPWSKLYIAAEAFLQATYNMELINKLKQGQIKNVLTVKDLPAEYAIKTFTTEMIKEAEAAKAFYQNLFKFDKALAQYFDELPKRGVVVVTDSEGHPSAREMSLEQMASLVGGEGRLTGIGTQASVESQIENKFKADQDHVEHGRAAFMGVNARLEAFYSQRLKKQVKNKKSEEMEEQDYQRQGGLLMWKSGGEWEIAVINNKGAIAEAYVSFLFTRHHTKKDYLCNSERGKSPYYNHSFIESFYKNYINKVTDLAAVVEEDVIGKYAQYAVKAKGAEMSSPETHIRTASHIVASTSKISPKKLKKEIKNAFDQDKAIAPLVKGKIKDSLTGAIEFIDDMDRVKKRMIKKGWISVEVDEDWLDAVQEKIEEGLLS